MADYFRQANEDTFVAIQIEHADAVEVVDKIAALPGVDVLFIGPADLSQSMGIPGQWEHPRLWQAIERTAQAAARSGIHWAILPFSADHAQRYVDLGCRMLAVGMDTWAVQRGLRSFLTEYALKEPG
jgi:4-hydroxy-2-oxoheptanedioate aldolase